MTDHPTTRPSPAEVPSTTTVRRFRARSTGLNNGSTWVVGPVLAEVHVTTWEHTYRASYAVHVDGRHQFGGCADHLDDEGLPKGPPVVDWSELRPELRHTGELRPGDVVQHHGMRLQLGPIAEHAGPHGPCWRSTGTILNVPELEAAAAADPSSTAAFILSRLADHPGTWAVQGNRLARWTVEAPAPPGWWCTTCQARHVGSTCPSSPPQGGAR